jgi:VanZ family protein
MHHLHNQSTLEKYVGIAAWTLLCFAAYVTMCSIGARPTTTSSTLLEHIGAFTAIGLLFYLAYRRRLAFVCLIVLASPVVLEFAQLFTPDRHARLLDVFEKMAGGILGIVGGFAILSFRDWLYFRRLTVNPETKFKGR